MAIVRTTYGGTFVFEFLEFGPRFIVAGYGKFFRSTSNLIFPVAIWGEDLAIANSIIHGHFLLRA